MTRSSPKGTEGQTLVVKGRLRTLSSDVESRKFTSQEETQRGVHIGCIVLCPIQRTMSISLGVGYRVAYPDARQCESPTMG